MSENLNKKTKTDPAASSAVETIVMPTDFDDLSDEKKEYYFEKAARLVDGLYWCNRVWSAWSYGTMTADDFVLASEDDVIINAIAEELYQERKKEVV